MDYQIAQRTRYLLQTRVRRVKNAGLAQYQEQLKFFLQFLDFNIVFSAVINELEGKSSLNKDDFFKSLHRGSGYDFDNENDYIYAAYLGLKFIVDSDPNQAYRCTLQAFSSIRGGDECRESDDEMLEDINTYWLNYLYEYLDESIDNRNSILLTLKKYKQSAEWFRKKRLIDISENGALYGKSGERGLALDLFESIHNEGIDFTIEPSSTSGEVDLIMNQTNEEKVVLDAKYITIKDTPAQVKTKVIKAFRQIHSYCNDYNTSNGYLLFFINSDLSLDIESNQLDGFRVVHLNGRSIFFLNVDIFENKKSASQRGVQARIVLTEKDLQPETSQTEEEK